MQRLPLVVALLAACAAPDASETQGSGGPTGGQVLTERSWHLGNDPTPDWTEAPEEPEGVALELTFEAEAPAGESVLALRQRSVDGIWHVELGGERVATLERHPELVTRYVVLPPGAVVDGTNSLRIAGEDPADDVTLGELVWYDRSLRELFDLRPATVLVRDAETGAPLPARVSFVDSAGGRPELYYGERALTAVRPGVCYTGDGRVELELPAGRYTVYASRGLEWSLAQARWKPGDPPLELALTRELDTEGFVACDTHVHTLTHSGHGDASVEERQVTLAGEGVELAIATDHNHNTDYAPVQHALGLDEHYTAVVGNEVTTPIGHLNAFPLDPEDEVPPFELEDIVRIVEGARLRGAEVVVLNHPRWPSHEDSPHGKLQLDPGTGEWAGEWAVPFDALELINSDTEEELPMVLFGDWFALLNRGERVCAVGSSDSHAVDVVVGQGRTYVASASDDPSALDLDACFASLAGGRSSISMGLFADLRWREGRGTAMGATIPAADLGGLELRVAAPAWGDPERVQFFANGELVSEERIRSRRGRPTDQVFALDPGAGWPEHDFWLVALAFGGAVGEGAWWPLRNDYTLAATNPVYVDVDGDGECTRPRELARRLIEGAPTEEALLDALEKADAAVLAQVLWLLRTSEG